MEEQPAMRYAHSEGFLDLCFDETGEHLLTCGPDGDVRVYKGFEDDDPVSHRVGDSAYCVACMKSRIYVAADDNAVQCLTLSDGELDGVVVRFTTHATHFVLSESGKTMVACASDFSIKVIDIETSRTKVLTGHSAPVLSVALHPKESHIASSSCDGTVRVWAVSDGTLVKSFTCLPKTNDFFASKILCRLCWNKSGSMLFVPVEKALNVYDSQNWNIAFKLTHDSIGKDLSVAKLSPCGKFVAAAAVDGAICVWQLANKSCMFSQKHPRGHTVTGLAWNPSVSSRELIFTDNYGYVGQFRNVISTAALPKDAKASNDAKIVKSADKAVKASDLFDDVDDDDIIAACDDDDDAMSAGDGRVPGVDTDAEDDDLESMAKSSLASGVGDDDRSRSPVLEAPAVEARKQPTVVRGGWEPVSLQRPFQSGSAPATLSTRFMMWNSVGLVIQYNTEEEQSINVEFHDTATHHSLHVNNATLNHTIADLSTEALLLACEADEDHSSQLVCMHFSSWDGCKEWSVPMPDGEDIQVACLGNGWLAVGTDRRFVRIFTIAGIQKQVLSVAGPIVAMSAHGNKLMIVYHEALGVPGDQCLSVKLMDVSDRRFLFVERLPLSSKSTLCWIGFSAEGMPFSFDSAGILRRYSHGVARSWVPVANLRQLCKGKLDNYWLIGINEKSDQIRTVLCKGAKYPVVLPRPPVQLLQLQLPLCEPSTDKSAFEDKYQKSLLLAELFEMLEEQGVEVDSMDKQRAMMSQQESLMKLFALSCKSKREFRAVEVATLMPNSRTVQLAIRYASQTGNIQVAQRLNDIVRDKTEQEQEQILGRSRPDMGGARAGSDDWRSGIVNHSANRKRRLDEEEEPDNDVEDDDGDEEDNQTNKKPTAMLLVNKKHSDSINGAKKPISISQSSAKKNPFKVSSNNLSAEKMSATTVLPGKGTSVFDNMEKTKSGRSGNAAASHPLNDMGSSGGSLKKKTGSVQQTKLFVSNKTDKTNNKLTENSALTTIADKSTSAHCTGSKGEAGAGKSGFQLWFEENRATLLAEAAAEGEESNEDLVEADLMITAAKKFRQLEKSEQQKWQVKAKSLTESGERGNKRKRDDESEEDDVSNDNHVDDEDIENTTGKEVKLVGDEKKVKTVNSSQNTKNKLASFSFSAKNNN